MPTQKIGNLELSKKIDGSGVVTLALSGVQNHSELFHPHLSSMRMRDIESNGEIILLDYTDRLDLAWTAKALADFICQEYAGFREIHLDGVSCGAKVFVWVLFALRQMGRDDVAAKIVLNCINGVVGPKDMRNPAAPLVRLIPYCLSFIITDIMRSRHWDGSRKDREKYDKLHDQIIRQLNCNANINMGWPIFKDQITAMLTPLPMLASKVQVRQLNVVLSTKDSQVYNDRLQESLKQVAVAKYSTSVVVIDTEHSTLAYEPEKWKAKFYSGVRDLLGR